LIDSDAAKACQAFRPLREWARVGNLKTQWRAIEISMTVVNIDSVANGHWASEGYEDH
jgi:hypothetical protein